MESTLYAFLPGGVCLPCDHRLDFDIRSIVRIQSNSQYAKGAEGLWPRGGGKRKMRPKTSKGREA